MSDEGLDQKQVKRTIENAGGSSSSDSTDIKAALSGIMENLSDEEQDILLTDLTEREIKHIAVIDTVGEDDDITQKFLESFRTHKVSRKRKGRKELGDIAEAFAGLFEAEQAGKLDKVKGAIGL